MGIAADPSHVTRNESSDSRITLNPLAAKCSELTWRQSAIARSIASSCSALKRDR